MPRSYLVQFPAEDARPSLTSLRTADRAAILIRDRVRAWLGSINYNPAIKPTDENISDSLAACIIAGKGSGFAAAKACERVLGWTVDDALVSLFMEAVANLPFCNRLEQHEWVMRTKTRFPAADGDLIEWTDAAGKEFAGSVYVVNKTTAHAVVQPVDETLPLMRVPAENVYANTTKGAYSFATAKEMGLLGEVETLGMRPAPAEPVEKELA